MLSTVGSKEQHRQHQHRTSPLRQDSSTLAGGVPLNSAIIALKTSESFSSRKLYGSEAGLTGLEASPLLGALSVPLLHVSALMPDKHFNACAVAFITYLRAFGAKHACARMFVTRWRR